MNELTQEYVRKLFDYRDGELYWKISKQGRKIGVPAGSVDKRGYRRIRVNGKRYRAHRLIFLWHHGYLPEFLDHIDRDKSNNDISNLREATISQNAMNQKKRKFYAGKPTSSDFTGVTWNKHAKKWVVHIKTNGKRKYHGYYDSEIEAAIVYNKAAIKRDGKFVKLNIIPG